MLNKSQIIKEFKKKVNRLKKYNDLYFNRDFYYSSGIFLSYFKTDKDNVDDYNRLTLGQLIYTPSIQTKSLSQLTNSFFSFIHVCFTKIDVVLVVNSANGPFGLLTKIFGIKT